MMNSPASIIDKKAVALSFGRAAGSYDAHASLQRQSALDLAERVTQNPDSGRILDLGCGTGFARQVLAARYPQAEITGLDIALPMLQFSRHKYGNTAQSLICGDAESLPLAADSFDLVFSNLAIQWCSHYQQLFGEIRRILKPGGSALLSTFGPATLQELRQAWSTVDDHVHVNEFHSSAELAAALASHSFRDVTIETQTCVRHYRDVAALARELKAIGAHNINYGKAAGLTGKNSLRRLQESFQVGAEPGRGVAVTRELLSLSQYR
ncbi:MAG: malonyl-ACP O-methyltransferase BioC [Pseudohongiellaceae bacterium]